MSEVSSTVSVMSENPSPQSPQSSDQPGEPAAPQPSTPPPPAYGAAPSTAQQSEGSGKGLGIAVLIIGILAFLGFAIPVLNVFSALLAIVGLVLGILALRKASARGVPLSGVILSGLALLLSVIFIVVYAVGFGAALNEVQSGSSAVEEPAEEDAAEEDAAEEEAQPVEPDVGTRENPAPLGTTVEIVEFGDPVYEVVLGPVTLNAADAVADANMFNEPAPEGFQYALLPVSVTYVGEETGTPWLDLSIEFVTAAGTTHTQSDTLAVAPDPTLLSINELYPGGTGTGNVVIAIPVDDAENGTWTISPLFGDPFFLPAQ